jgi:hypothetical protein
MPVQPYGPSGHVISEAIVTYLNQCPDHMSRAGEVYTAVREMVGRDVPSSNLREIARKLGIEQQYDIQHASYWTLPKHLWLEVIDTDRELAQALISQAIDTEFGAFAAYWTEHVAHAGRQWQVARVLAELAITSE